MRQKNITIGIMPQDKIRERTLAIAKGKLKPKPGDPKIWFTSIASLAQVLSEDNRALLEVIYDTQPSSIKELSDMTGRKSSNLSRTLKTLARYGFVQLKKVGKVVKPVAKVTGFKVYLPAMSH